MTVSALSATARILAKDEHLKVTECPERGYEIFTAFDYPGRDPAVGEFSVGIGVEDGEFLYSLVRGLKPLRVLELGSNVGISSRYIALAMSDNGGGVFDTIEHDGSTSKMAREKMSWIDGVTISVILMPSIEFVPTELYDFIFIDSGPRGRMPEMLRMFEYIQPGGLIWVHDYKQQEIEDVVRIMGNIPVQAKDMIRAGALRCITLNSRHGGCIFQKPFELDDWIRDAIMKGK